MNRSNSLKAIKEILFLSGLFFFNFIARIIFAPLLPVIEQEMGLDHTRSGSLFLFLSIGYFLSILFSGFVSSKINHKRSIAFSAILLGLVLLGLGQCSTLLSLQLCLFGVGVAAGIYFPSALATITALVPAAYLARGISMHELAPNAAFVCAPLLSDFFLSSFSWRSGMGCLGVILLFGGAYYAFSSQGIQDKGRAPDFQALRCFSTMPAFWGLCLLFALAIGATHGVYSMAPLFLIHDHGMTQVAANRLLAISRVSAVFIPIFGGWVADRFGSQLTMGLVLLFAGICTFCMGVVESKVFLITLVVAQPLFAVCFFSAGFAVLSNLKAERFGNLAVTFCLPLAFLLGAGVVPILIGWIGDIATISVGFVAMGAVMACAGAVFSLLSRRKG